MRCEHMFLYCLTSKLITCHRSQTCRCSICGWHCRRHQRKKFEAEFEKYAQTWSLGRRSKTSSHLLRSVSCHLSMPSIHHHLSKIELNCISHMHRHRSSFGYQRCKMHMCMRGIYCCLVSDICLYAFRKKFDFYW